MTPRPMLAATTIGDAVARACRPASAGGCAAGQVVGNFSSGFYVRAGETVFAVAGPQIAPGPIHLVLEAPPPPPEQSVVRLGPDRLETGSCTVDLSRAARYRPNQPSPAQLSLSAAALASLDPLDAPPEDIAHVWPAVRAAVLQSEPFTAKTLLEGLGGGLTPTGDDVLAGLLLFAHWAEPASPVPGEIALQAATTDLSRCYLAWAAAGQSIQPVHDLLDAAAQVASASNPAGASAARDRFDRVAAQVASIGHSSGKGMLAGLGLAAAAGSTRG